MLDPFTGPRDADETAESEIVTIIRKIFLDNLNSGNLSAFSSSGRSSTACSATSLLTR